MVGFNHWNGSQLVEGAVAVWDSWQVCAATCDRWREQQRQSGEDRQLKPLLEGGSILGGNPY